MQFLVQLCVSPATSLSISPPVCVSVCLYEGFNQYISDFSWGKLIEVFWDGLCSEDNASDTTDIILDLFLQFMLMYSMTVTC